MLVSASAIVRKGNRQEISISLSVQTPDTPGTGAESYIRWQVPDCSSTVQLYSGNDPSIDDRCKAGATSGAIYAHRKVTDGFGITITSVSGRAETADVGNGCSIAAAYAIWSALSHPPDIGDDYGWELVSTTRDPTE